MTFGCSEASRPSPVDAEDPDSRNPVRPTIKWLRPTAGSHLHAVSRPSTGRQVTAASVSALRSTTRNETAQTLSVRR